MQGKVINLPPLPEPTVVGELYNGQDNLAFTYEQLEQYAIEAVLLDRNANQNN